MMQETSSCLLTVECRSLKMAYLKKKDLQNGLQSYRDTKTDQQLFIKWEKPMQKLSINITSESLYLLMHQKQCVKFQEENINASTFELIES